MSFEHFDSLDPSARSRYELKLHSSGLTTCPYKLPAGSWVNEPTKWPKVEWSDVYSYLVETPGVFTREAMKNHKSLEAHNFFVSGWVQTILHFEIPGTQNYVLKADVRPSQRMNDPPHHPWVSCSKDGTVITAHCDCKAGCHFQGSCSPVTPNMSIKRLCESCSHVAAVLFKIEAAVRIGYTSLACTDQVCMWNKCFTKKIQPERIAQIKFFKDKAKQRLQCRQTPVIPPATEQQQETLLKQLAQCSRPPIALSSFSDYHHPFSVKQVVPVKEILPLYLRTLYQPTAVPEKLDDLIAKAQNSMKVTEAEVAYLEKTTRNQSSSVVWHQMRCGRITASSAYQFLHTDPQQPAESLVKKICLPGQSLSVPSVNWGISHEKTALQSFSDAFSQIHDDVKVRNTGMRLSLDEPFLGASPDAMAVCSCCGSSVVEIKCPYVFRDSELSAMYQDTRCCLTADNTLKSNHQYYAQVQVQMYVFQVSAAQFVLWTPNFTIITKVARDDKFIAEMLDRLKLLWPAHVLPELITRSLEKRQKKADDSQNSEHTYCYCKKDIGGQMIGCDNPSCHIKWFHITCLKRKTVPKGSWYCKTCKPRAS